MMIITKTLNIWETVHDIMRRENQIPHAGYEGYVKDSEEEEEHFGVRAIVE
jgi:hypothetical protein